MFYLYFYNLIFKISCIPHEPTASINCFDTRAGIEKIVNYYVNLIPISNVTSLSLHGRWASKILATSDITGPAIDEIDTIFQNWFNRRKCVTQINGICYSDPKSTEYGVLGTQCAYSEVFTLSNVLVRYFYDPIL